MLVRGALVAVDGEALVHQGRQYAELLDEAGGRDHLPEWFNRAERAIGWKTRPIIMDYDELFGAILAELSRRQREVP